MVSNLTVTALQRAQQTLDRALTRLGTGQIETSSTVNRNITQTKADLTRAIAAQQAKVDSASQQQAKFTVQANAYGEAQARYLTGANIIQSSIRDDSSVRERLSAVSDAQKLYDSIDPLYGNNLYQGAQVAFRDQEYGLSAPTGIGQDDEVSPYDRVFFAANDGVGGFELWSTLGTPGSEIAVGDIEVGPAGQFSGGVQPKWAAANGLLYYTATTAANGTELWRSDGTKEGTFLLSDLTPGAGSSTISNLTQFKGSLYFTLSEGSNHYLYKSNGRASDTVRIGQIATGAAPKSFTVAGDSLYYVSQTPSNGVELRRTDGTLSGSDLVTDIRTGPGSSFPEYLKASGDKVFFSAIGDTGGRELYVADTNGARRVADINPGNFDGLPITPVMFMQAVDGGVVFTAQDPSAGVELYYSNGTGVTRLTDLNPGPTDTPFGGLSRVAALGNKVAFAATTADGFYTPYLTDLAGNVQRIFSDDGDALTFSSKFTAAGDYVYFIAAEAGSAGSRLYRVDTATATATAIAGTQDLPLTNQIVFGDQVVATATKSGIDRTFLYGPDGLYEVPGLVSQGFAVLVPGITTEKLAQSAQTLKQAALDVGAARQAALLSAESADIIGKFYRGTTAIAEDAKERLTAVNSEEELQTARQAAELIQTGTASVSYEAQAGSLLAGALQQVGLTEKAEAEDLQARKDAKLDEARRQQRTKLLRGEISTSIGKPSTVGLTTLGLDVTSSRDIPPPITPAYRPVITPYSLAPSASA
jgi:ELWxxDGT repeat protein